MLTIWLAISLVWTFLVVPTVPALFFAHTLAHDCIVSAHRYDSYDTPTRYDLFTMRNPFKRRSTQEPAVECSIPKTPFIPRRTLLPEDSATPRPMSRQAPMHPPTPIKPTSSLKQRSVTPAPPSSRRDRSSSFGHAAYESDGEALTMRMGNKAGTYYGRPLPPSTHLGSRRPATSVNLHWQLLPKVQGQAKYQLHFDVAFPIDLMRFHRFSGEHVRRLAPEDHHKLATSEPLTKMVIKVKHYPDWEIFVKRSSGIRCLDVFQAIFEAFNTPLTPAEKQMLVPSHMRASVEETFRLRCKAWPGLPDAELAHGWKRVDVLQQATLFLGLTQPQAGGDWMLNLGRST